METVLKLGYNQSYKNLFGARPNFNFFLYRGVAGINIQCTEKENNFFCFCTR